MPIALRCERKAATVGQTPGSCLPEHLLLGETPGGVRLESPAHNRRALARQPDGMFSMASVVKTSRSALEFGSITY
jgi:hypothetical protein